jgi:hypothetical protein
MGSRSFALDLFLFRPIPTHHRVDKRSLGKVTARHRRIIEGWRISGPDRAGVRLAGVRGVAFADPRLGDGSAGLSAFDDVQDPASAAMAHAL